MLISLGVIVIGIYLMAVGRRTTAVATEMSLHGTTVPELEVGGLYFRPDEVVSLIGVGLFMLGATVIVKMTFGKSTHLAPF
ncbi:hypothetical protein OB905_13230 [Halobacteria archaeon AArc-dxtr1]|nr:hypothetical protein [Halobacteria archaeon AArc-dxtr1]